PAPSPGRRGPARSMQSDPCQAQNPPEVPPSGQRGADREPHSWTDAHPPSAARVPSPGRLIFIAPAYPAFAYGVRTARMKAEILGTESPCVSPLLKLIQYRASLNSPTGLDVQ